MNRKHSLPASQHPMKQIMPRYRVDICDINSHLVTNTLSLIFHVLSPILLTFSSFKKWGLTKQEKRKVPLTFCPSVCDSMKIQESNSKVILLTPPSWHSSQLFSCEDLSGPQLSCSLSTVHRSLRNSSSLVLPSLCWKDQALLHLPLP